MKSRWGLFLLCVSLWGCNKHEIEFPDPFQSIEVRYPVSVAFQEVDILWVIDNSGSMCQEQKVLRDNFNKFIDELRTSSIDFHIAVTTTHAPAPEVRGVIEPVAREGQIQSTPQPVPGPNVVCLMEIDEQGQRKNFAPLRDALSTALQCLANQGNRGKYQWTDDQIACAISGTPDCMASVGGVDTNGDSFFDALDLFPPTSEYRKIPKVLRASDYRDPDGVMDMNQIKNDFACMSFVGTRGYGLEKGLQAAVKAVSLDHTGGAVNDEGAPVLKQANTGAPNHGFIRKDSSFSLIFVTDENDCSHDGSLAEFGNACGGNMCDYENTSQSGGSSLIPVEKLADDLRANLSQTKGRSIRENELVISSIHGMWDRYEGPKPNCEVGDRPVIRPSCSSPVGEAYSGDRYERFIRQFENFYPNDAVQKALEQDHSFDVANDFSVTEFGWICAGDFSPALVSIGESLFSPGLLCIQDQVFPCNQDRDCPLHSDGAPGSCIANPGSPGEKFCDSAIELTLTRNPDQQAKFELEEHPYCIPGSVRDSGGERLCTVDHKHLTWIACPLESGFFFEWSDASPIPEKRLLGYRLEVAYQSKIRTP